jgi:hypothetical protein
MELKDILKTAAGTGDAGGGQAGVEEIPCLANECSTLSSLGCAGSFTNEDEIGVERAFGKGSGIHQELSFSCLSNSTILRR